METKTLKIEVPNGYKIDKEKSTFENIVFKKADDVEIKWNKNYFGVEIKTDNEHFILDGDPTYFMDWNDAMRFYNIKHRSHTWNLPTVKQLQVIYKYFYEINEVIEENDGFALSRLIYWSIKEKDYYCAHFIDIENGLAGYDSKDANYCVRAVSSL